MGRFEVARGFVLAPDPGRACGWTSLDDLVDALRSGETYVNYHTADYPADELRGQIEPLTP